MRKQICAIFMGLVLILLMTGCSTNGEQSDAPSAAGAESSQEQRSPANLLGQWTQSNSDSTTDYMAADITADTIDVYWVSDSGDTLSLYWSGSFIAPSDAAEPYRWTSLNDHSKTDSALLASSDDTKEFTYENDEISFSASAMGTTKTIRMSKSGDAPMVPPSQTENVSTEPLNKEYAMGETWTVDGQWSLTVDSVEITTERNEYADKNPAAVYIVSYTYSNIGYSDANGIMNGLFFNMDDTIVDSTGLMGYSYPGDITDYAQEVPVGASCKAQACIGVDNPGAFKLHVTLYDGNGIEQTAVFSITP